MEAVQKRRCDDRSVFPGWHAERHALTDSLMRTRRVEITAVLDEHREQMPLAQNKDVVQAFASYASEETLADRVCTR